MHAASEPPSSLSQTTADRNDERSRRKKAILLEYYKERLVMMARAHATLLCLLRSMKKRPSREDEDGVERETQEPALSVESLGAIQSSFADILDTDTFLGNDPELREWLSKHNERVSSDASSSLPNNNGNNKPENNTAVTSHRAQQNVRVGVGVLVRDPRHPNKVFAGIRKGSHGAGLLALPGGHLEMNESWDNCAKREVLEETGLVVEHIRFAHVTNDVMQTEGKHYVTIFMMAECSEDSPEVPQLLEPNKCTGWSSYSWNDLQEMLQQQQAPKNENNRINSPTLFGPLLRLVEQEPREVMEFLFEDTDANNLD